VEALVGQFARPPKLPGENRAQYRARLRAEQKL